MSSQQKGRFIKKFGQLNILSISICCTFSQNVQYYRLVKKYIGRMLRVTVIEVDQGEDK